MTDQARVAPYLNCPRCGLSIDVRSRWLAVTHCPRCVARAHTIVELFSSRLPARALYGESWRPRADAEADVHGREAAQ
jgi:hypothetical protein